MRYLRAYWKSIVWGLFILYMSLIREYNLTFLPEFSWRDKLFHAAAYFIFGLLLGYELRKDQISGVAYWSVLIFLPVIFGGIIELLQHYCFAPRVGDWFDFAANTIGVLIACLICRIFVTK